MQFSVSLLPWRSQTGSSVPLCQHFWTCQLPPAPSPDGGGTGPTGGQVLSLQAPELHLSSLGDGRLLSPCIDSRLYTQCLDVLGTLLCSVSAKRTVLGPQRLQAGPCQRVPSPIPFLLLHLALTSELKGLGLFPLQP